MKNKVILISIILAGIFLVLALIAKITNHVIISHNPTLIMLAQICLLFAIAWGVGKRLEHIEKD
jgi:hypothetical protein